MAGIRVSPQHGVNPSMGVCFFCGQDDGTVVLPGRLRGDEQAPRRAVWTREPCPACKVLMEQGVMLISVDEKRTTDRDNPFRTGKIAVIRDSGIARMITNAELLADILEKRVCFVPDDAWAKLGLPENNGEAKAKGYPTMDDLRCQECPKPATHVETHGALETPVCDEHCIKHEGETCSEDQEANDAAHSTFEEA